MVRLVAQCRSCMTDKMKRKTPSQSEEVSLSVSFLCIIMSQSIKANYNDNISFCTANIADTTIIVIIYLQIYIIYNSVGQPWHYNIWSASCDPLSNDDDDVMPLNETILFVQMVRPQVLAISLLKNGVLFAVRQQKLKYLFRNSILLLK